MLCIMYYVFLKCVIVVMGAKSFVFNSVMNRTYELKGKIKTYVSSAVFPCLLCSNYASWPSCTVCLCAYLLYHWHLTLQPLAPPLALSPYHLLPIHPPPSLSLQAQLSSLIKVLLWLASGISCTCSVFSVWWDQEEGQREGRKRAMCLLALFSLLQHMACVSTDTTCCLQDRAWLSLGGNS